MIQASRKQWIKFAIAMVLYLAFIIWLKSWLGIVAIRLYNQENTLDMVEEIYQSACRNRDELGGCHRIRSGGSIFCQSVFLPELRHSFVFAGEVVARGRLSVC